MASPDDLIPLPQLLASYYADAVELGIDQEALSHFNYRKLHSAYADGKIPVERIGRLLAVRRKDRTVIAATLGFAAVSPKAPRQRRNSSSNVAVAA